MGRAHTFKVPAAGQGRDRRHHGRACFCSCASKAGARQQSKPGKQQDQITESRASSPRPTAMTGRLARPMGIDMTDKMAGSGSIRRHGTLIRMWHGAFEVLWRSYHCTAVALLLAPASEFPTLSPLSVSFGGAM